MASDPRVRLADDALTQTLNAPGALTGGAVSAIPGAAFASISVQHREGKLEAPTSSYRTLCPRDGDHPAPHADERFGFEL